MIYLIYTTNICLFKYFCHFCHNLNLKTYNYEKTILLGIILGGLLFTVNQFFNLNSNKLYSANVEALTSDEKGDQEGVESMNVKVSQNTTTSKSDDYFITYEYQVQEVTACLGKGKLKCQTGDKTEILLSVSRTKLTEDPKYCNL